MLIFALENESELLGYTRKIIADAVPDVKLITFALPDAAAEQTLKELSLLPGLSAFFPDTSFPKNKLRVRCFGYFEVYWQGKPLIFSRRKAKELFAFLIDREGTVCTAEDIISALWEDEENIKAAKHRLRTVLADLKTTLRRIGMEDILIRERRQLAIRPDMLDCDYYRFLNGDTTAVDTFRGEYMKDYSWAEATNGKLCFADVDHC